MIEIKLFYKTIKKESCDYFLILEAGTNHYEFADFQGISILDAAKKMIKEAHIVGADAIKFQAYTADKLASKQFALEQYSYMRRRDSLNALDYIKLIDYGKKIGIKVFFTIFDIDLLNIIGDKVEIFKIASPDITNIPLLIEINKYQKPVIISTAGAEGWEIEDAITTLENCEVIIMHCRAIYPTLKNQLDLSVIKTLNKEFPKNIIGWSSHIPETYYGHIAMAFGANVFEYHFKITNYIKGGDYSVSINQNDVIDLKQTFFNYQEAYGNNEIRITKEETDLRKNGRRGLYAKRNLEVGERIELDDFIALRPSFIKGFDIVEANDIGLIYNKRLKYFISKGSPLQRDNLEIIND